MEKDVIVYEVLACDELASKSKLILCTTEKSDTERYLKDDRYSVNARIVSESDLTLEGLKSRLSPFDKMVVDLVLKRHKTTRSTDEILPELLRNTR